MQSMLYRGSPQVEKAHTLKITTWQADKQTSRLLHGLCTDLAILSWCQPDVSHIHIQSATQPSWNLKTPCMCCCTSCKRFFVPQYFKPVFPDLVGGCERFQHRWAPSFLDFLVQYSIQDRSQWFLPNSLILAKLSIFSAEQVFFHQLSQESVRKYSECDPHSPWYWNGLQPCFHLSSHYFDPDLVRKSVQIQFSLDWFSVAAASFSSSVWWRVSERSPRLSFPLLHGCGCGCAPRIGPIRSVRYQWHHSNVLFTLP